MSGNKSSSESDAVLNMMRGVDPADWPAYAEMLDTLPSDDAGTGAAPVAYSGYARQGPGSFSAPAAGPSGSRQIQNDADVVFPAWAAGGTVAGLAYYDAVSGGNFKRLGVIAGAPITIAPGETPRFPVGSITIIED